MGFTELLLWPLFVSAAWALLLIGIGIEKQSPRRVGYGSVQLLVLVIPLAITFFPGGYRGGVWVGLILVAGLVVAFVVEYVRFGTAVEIIAGIITLLAFAAHVFIL